MTYEQAVEWLEEALRFGPGIKPGLERIEALCERLGHPERAFRSTLVAGTNGKGTVTATLSALLSSLGHKTAAYFSPHLVSYCERYRIEGADVTPEDFAAAIAEVASVAPSMEEPPTPFEALSGAAFLLFRSKGVEEAVLEIGMGGKGDATNVVSPALSVITHIAFDHSEWLGETLEAIALEKAGIMRAGVPVILGQSAEEAQLALLGAASQLGAQVYEAEKDFTFGQLALSLAGTSFDYASEGLEGRFTTPLIGLAQAHNTALALQAAELLAGPLTEEQAQAGLDQVRLPARFEVRKLGRKTLVLDVGHNPDAIAAFISTWRAVFGKQRCALVFGAMKDKDWREALRQLAAISNTLYACQAAGTRPASSSELAHFAPEAGFMTALDSGSVEQAVAAALADEAPLVAIVGSHYVVGEALLAGPG